MAFAAYDFYLDGRPTNIFGNTRPEDGSALDEYILDRLIDSLRLNATKFLEWLAILKVLPTISQLATTTLLASAGNFAFPVGTAVGAFIGSQTDIFDLGGADKLRDLTLTELETLKARLDEQAAWPIGLIFGNTSNPFDQHQLLAIGYDVVDSDTCEVKVWDNRDSDGLERTMRLDTSGDEIEETGVKDTVKGVFVEEYKPIRPPATLK